MPRVTRKKTVHVQGKHVSSIRKDIEAFHAFLRLPRTDVQVKKRFKDIFGKTLSEKRVGELLKVSPQKGGMAPIDYMMGAPDVARTAVPYIQRGFGFANIDSIAEGSPKEYLGSTPQMGGRRNKTIKGKSKGKAKAQSGGGIADFAASVGAQPFLMSAPPTIFQAAARMSTGQVGLPAPQPEINPLNISPQVTINSGKGISW